jgi:hypothetical protein
MASTVRCRAESVKASRHQLEHHRAVLQLAAQAAERGGQDAAVVGDHRLAQRADQGVGRPARLAAVAGGLGGRPAS